MYKFLTEISENRTGVYYAVEMAAITDVTDALDSNYVGRGIATAGIIVESEVTQANYKVVEKNSAAELLFLQAIEHFTTGRGNIFNQFETSIEVEDADVPWAVYKLTVAKINT